MLENPKLLSNSQLFEDLNDQFSEKISGGTSIIEGPLVDLTTFPFTSNILTLLRPDLQEVIDLQVQELFPAGVNNTAALACTTNANGELVCEVTVDGAPAEVFTVPLQP